MKFVNTYGQKGLSVVVSGSELEFIAKSLIETGSAAITEFQGKK